MLGNDRRTKGTPFETLLADVKGILDTKKQRKGFQSSMASWTPQGSQLADLWQMEAVFEEAMALDADLSWEGCNIAETLFFPGKQQRPCDAAPIRSVTPLVIQKDFGVQTDTPSSAFIPQDRPLPQPSNHSSSLHQKIVSDQQHSMQHHHALKRQSSSLYLDDMEEEEELPRPKNFVTASEKWREENYKKGISKPPSSVSSNLRRIPNKKTKFVSPLITSRSSGTGKEDNAGNCSLHKQEVDERLKNIDPQMVETIRNEIMDQSTPVAWDHIAGLEHAKKTIREIVVWPMLRPDMFSGIRGPPKGLLLFGPPGTGKTLIGKCIASQCKATFFSISSSSLTSKWVGDGEKMVRALFAVAKIHQPSVIFIDEIDSLLTQRSEGEQEATRRIKTEFLVQFDGCGTSSEDRILLIGATNRPQEIDEAARRRFRKKLYIPLPEGRARKKIITNLLSKQVHDLTEEDIEDIITKTEGYSGSDMDGLVREAAIGPIRDITDIEHASVSDVRPISKSDFIKALLQVRASVSEKDLDLYLGFEKEYGSLG